MMPLPTARLRCVAGSASDAPTAANARDRHIAAAGVSFFRLPASLLALALAACGTAPVSDAPTDTTPALSPASELPTSSKSSIERADEGRDNRPAESETAASPTRTKPSESRSRPDRPRESDNRTPPRTERRAAEATPLAPPAIVERRETPALPRVARESVPQVRAGDDVVALAVEHGFDPVPVAVPENTRFSRLRIGMTKQDAEALLGRPDTSLHYANEGARIPFYASDDSSRWETFYRGQGRLMFSGAWLTGEVRLIRIEFDPDEDGEPDPDHPQRDRR